MLVPVIPLELFQVSRIAQPPAIFAISLLPISLPPSFLTFQTPVQKSNCRNSGAAQAAEIFAVLFGLLSFDSANPRAEKVATARTRAIPAKPRSACWSRIGDFVLKNAVRITSNAFAPVS